MIKWRAGKLIVSLHSRLFVEPQTNVGAQANSSFGWCSNLLNDPTLDPSGTAKIWEKNSQSKQVHLHKPSFMEIKNSGNIYDGNFIAGTVSDKADPLLTTSKGLRKRKAVSYAEIPTSTSESETDSDYMESKKNKVQIESSSSLVRSSNSVQQSNPQETSDLVTDDDRVEKVQMSNMDFNRFTEEFQKMENNKKWVLASQKVVEDELYKFSMRCRYEQNFIKEKVFTETELKEIRAYKPKPFQNTPQDLLEYLSSYQLARIFMFLCASFITTISDLRTQVFRSEPWKSPYNRQKDFDRDWIRNNIDNLLREYEADSLKREDHTEAWLLSHVWLFIDRVVENIEGVRVIRRESCSLVSSSRKNRNRNVAPVNSMPRKTIGRQGDLIIRCMSKEYECGEADQFDDLCIPMDLKEKKVRKLEIVGFIYAGLSLLLLRFDSPTGYIGRISHSKMLTIPSTIDEFGTAVLPTIMLAWKAKKIVSNVIEMMNQNDDENPLQALEKSCEDTLALSPPRDEIRRPSTFGTPNKMVKRKPNI
ncbi:hypothetical protein G9A89_021510 [Geosiphon pyriformis]|nr:hypothetical protein G9A89_021510 [Geosiphon pyriformis]